MLLGLELGTWAEWNTGIGSILAISVGFFYRKNDKKIQIEIKGCSYTKKMDYFYSVRKMKV